MYLRHTTRVKDGKAHTYWRLVRSVRVGRKVVQLGGLDAEGRAQARALARTITGGREQPELFEPIPAAAPPIPVRLDRVRLERGRRFGDVWLGWTLWRALQLDTLLERLLPIGREEAPWATMALVLVLARLCEPSSELHIAEDWYRRTALEDLLALPAPLVRNDPGCGNLVELPAAVLDRTGWQKHHHDLGLREATQAGRPARGSTYPTVASFPPIETERGVPGQRSDASLSCRVSPPLIDAGLTDAVALTPFSAKPGSRRNPLVATSC
jgi:hypothetical protein